MNKKNLLASCCTIGLLLASLWIGTSISQSKNYVIITFDDSDIQRSSDEAVAIMDSFGYKGVAFATVIWTDPAKTVWNHILQESWEIGSHTWTHPSLNSDQYNSISASRLVHEVADSKAWLETNLHTSIISFAYPGAKGYNNVTVLNALQNGGYLYGRSGPYPLWSNSYWNGDRTLDVECMVAGLNSIVYTTQNLVQRSREHGIAVIMFHGITSTPTPDEFGWGYVTPNDFRYFLTQIKNSELQPITFKEWDQLKHPSPTPTPTPTPPPNEQIIITITLQPFSMIMQYTLDSGTVWTAPSKISMWQREWTFANWSDGSISPSRTFTVDGTYILIYQ